MRKPRIIFMAKKIFWGILICVLALCNIFALTACDVDDLANNESEDDQTTEAPKDTDKDENVEEVSYGYKLIYLSNGDGTCSVVDVDIDPKQKESFVITIPEVSPDGEKVTKVSFSLCQIVPWAMTPADYGKMIALLLNEYCEHPEITEEYIFENGFFDAKVPFECKKVLSFYAEYDINAEHLTEAQKTELLEKYPTLNETPLFVRDPNATLYELRVLSRVLYNAGYGSFDAEEAHTAAKFNVGRSGAEYVKEIVFESAEVEIQKYALNCFINLEKITLPVGCFEQIPDGVFACSLLTDIVIPEGVTEIGNSAFYASEKLKTVTIPATVTTIGECAFEDCSELQEINFGGTVSQWNALNYKEVNCTIICSDGEIAKN